MDQIKAVKTYLELVECPRGAHQQRLLSIAVLRHFNRAAASRELLLNEQLFGQLQIIADWIALAMDCNARWVNAYDQKDPQKRPSRLLNFESFEKLYDTAYRDLAFPSYKKARLLGQDEGRDLTTVMSWEDGYRLVRLRSPRALMSEGMLMNHCIHKPDYLNTLGSVTHRLYSLRRPNNYPCATLEIKDDRVLQCRGPSNQPMPLTSMPYIREFMQLSKLKAHGPLFQHYMAEWRGECFHFEEFPDGMHLHGPVDLSETTQKIDFPPGTIIEGERRIIINVRSGIRPTGTNAEYLTVRHMNGPSRHRTSGPAEVTYHVATGRMVHSAHYVDGKFVSEQFHNPHLGESFRAAARFQVPVCVEATPSPSCTEAAVRAPGRNPSPA